jgi:hypothetical protein
MENTKNESNNYFRFQVFIGDKQNNGSVKKTKSVGMAYLSEGQNIYTLRLWTFSWDRYYVLPDKNDASRLLVMTREPSKSPESKNKYYWNIVGNGVVDSKNGVIRLDFDLLGVPIYMNLYPETSTFSKNIPGPESFQNAA